MSKKKKYQPKDMEELTEIFYGPDHERKRKYLDSMRSDVISPQREKKVIHYVNPSLEIEKINEKKGVQTFDYVIKSESLFLEITSLNFPPQTRENITLYLSQLDIPRKLSEAIAHIEEKDTSDYDDFYIGGVIFIAIEPIIFTDIMEEESLIRYIRKSTFLSSNINLLFILVDSAFDLTKEINSEVQYPPFIFVKEEEVRDIISRVFPKIKVIILSQ